MFVCGLRKESTGIGTNGVTADFMFSDRGTCWVPSCQNLSVLRNLSPQSVKKSLPLQRPH